MSTNDTKQTMISDVRGRATCTIPEAANLLGCNKHTAYRAARSGEIPTFRVGGRILVAVPALLASLGYDDENGAA